jgi:hypothetical protein
MKAIRNLIQEIVDHLTGDYLFEMANLSPKKTGLPYAIHLRHRSAIRHGPSMKVYPMGTAVSSCVIVVTIAADPQVIKAPRRPHIPERDLEALREFVRRNHAVLQRYWDEPDWPTDEMEDQLQKVERRG